MTARLGLMLGGLTAGNMLLWFLLQGYVLATTGAGMRADAFFASLAVPQLVLLVVNSSLAHLLVPFFSGKPAAQVRTEAAALALVVGGVFAALTLLLWLAAPAWVPLVVAGFDPAGKALAVSLTRVQLLGMPFSAVAAVLMAACHARSRFALAETAPLVATMAAFVAMVVVLPRHGVEGAAWVNVGRSAVAFAVLAPTLGLPVLAPWSSLAGVWARMRPLLLSASYYKSDQVFDRFLTSMGQPGELSLFYFAQQAALAINSVLGKGISAPAVPRLAVLARQGDWSGFHRLYRRRLVLLTGVSLLCCLAVGAIGALAWPLVHAVGSLRLLEGEDLAGAIGLFVLLSGVVVGGGAGLILSEAFFSCGDTRTPSLVTAGCFTAGLALKAAGFAGFGVQGLALATSCYFLSYPLLLFVLLEARLARQGGGVDAGEDRDGARQPREGPDGPRQQPREGTDGTRQQPRDGTDGTRHPREGTDGTRHPREGGDPVLPGRASARTTWKADAPDTRRRRRDGVAAEDGGHPPREAPT